MKLIFNDKSNLGGIYKILNLTNSRVYIGSSAVFYKRAYSHLHNLEMKRHQNAFLQNDFNKCGSDNFIFEVLEVVDGDKAARLVREQFFIDQHYDNQKQCYNLAKMAIDSRSGTRNKKMIDRTTDGRCKSPTEEVLAKRSVALKKAYKENPLLKEASVKNAKKRWAKHSANIVLLHKETKEEVHITTSLREFALTRGLSYKSLNQLTNGKTKSCGGWYLKVAHLYIQVKKDNKGNRLRQHTRPRLLATNSRE